MKTFFKKRWDKHYHQDNKNRYWHLTIDGLFSVIILTLIVANTYLSSTNYGKVLGTQHDEPNNIDVDQNINNNPTTTDIILDNKDQDEVVTIPSTNIQLKSLARYYTAEGEQLGIGPLPPTVGVSTGYRIFISLDGFTHNLENTLVSAKLPNNISLTDKSIVTFGDNMSFDNNSREIKWNLGNLSTNDKQQIIGLTFKVELTPSENQVGSPAVLLTNIKLSALDSISGKIITKINPNITTNLISDSVANSDGIIVLK